MKISILIPSRNRLDLLRNTIETVRRQNYENWEIVVSDNDSDDDYASYVAALDDPRILYKKTESFVSVTENWNRCLDEATGDYVIMLGDDDGLTPHYLDRVQEIIEEFDRPDFIYHSAWNYVYPQAMDSAPESRLIDVTDSMVFLNGIHAPSYLSREKAQEVAYAALNVQSRYGFNMQYFLFAKPFIDKLKQHGPFFQGPFPDFYAAQMAMLLAENAVIVPEPLVIIGISPRSYGYYFYNQKEDAGVDFLNSLSEKQDVPDSVLKALLPGSNMNTSWLMSVSIVKERLQNTFPDLRVGIQRYRLLQIRDSLRYDRIKPGSDQIKKLWPYLTITEKGLVVSLRLFVSTSRILPHKMREKLLSFMKIDVREKKYSDNIGDGRFGSLLEAFESMI